MPIALRKVWRDLWLNPGRTALVTLSITVGVLALGMTSSSNAQIRRQMNLSQRASHPSHVRLTLATPFDDEVVKALGRLAEVEQVEGWSTTGISWKPTLGLDWQEATLIALADYEHQQLDRVELWGGEWPNDDSVSIEFNHQQSYGAPGIGGALFFEVNDRPVLVDLGGTIRDPAQGPPPFNPLDKPVFYVTRNVIGRLTGGRDYNRLRFTVPKYSQEQARLAVDAVEEKLKRLGVVTSVSVFAAQLQDTDRSRAQEILDGLGLVLVVMAVVSLALSVFLVINTINAVIAEQVTQIGIMKTIGAVRRQIASLYLAGVIVYGLLGLGLAVPLGALGGHLLSRSLLYALNVQLSQFELSSRTLLYQIGVGLLTPLLAAMWPVTKGTAISVREAISTYGLGRGHYGSSRLDRLLGGVQGLPRMAALALRGTFRRPGRLVLTELTLIGAGAAFMTVITTSDSFQQTIDDIYQGWGYNMSVHFVDFQRVDEISSAIVAHQDVHEVEMWVWMEAASHIPGETDPSSNHTVQLRGVPRNSTMFSPELIAGRPLDPNDGHALILNQRLAQEMGAGVSDQVVIELTGGEETIWTVVGLAFDFGPTEIWDTAFVNLDILSDELHRSGRATVAQISTTANTRAAQDALKDNILDYFESKGIGISLGFGHIENRDLATAMWSLVSGLLQLMVVLMAAVGGIGLSSTLSINVIERRREIGIMRAIGASSLDVALIFISEGLLLGLISWVLAVPVSIVGGRYFVAGLGHALKFPFLYYYSMSGMWLWLAIVVPLALLASWLPTRRATRIRVHEALAYQ